MLAPVDEGIYGIVEFKFFDVELMDHHLRLLFTDIYMLTKMNLVSVDHPMGRSVSRLA